MIIAGFAGVGNTRNAIDFVCMLFKYSNFYQVSESLSEDEDIKAHKNLNLVIGWDEYYYYALIDTYKKYPEQIIVIPTVLSVLEKLKIDNIPIIVVYSKIDDKKECKKRYISRGNSKEFMDVFLNRWNKWIAAIQMLELNNFIELSTEQLSDVIGMIPFAENKIVQDIEDAIKDNMKSKSGKEIANEPV